MANQDPDETEPALPSPPVADDPHARAMLGRIRAALTGHEAQPVCIGRFEIVGVLGRGGMGVVYEARDRNLGRTVALKVIDAATDDARRRVLEEARALAKVEHRAVVRVHEADAAGDQVYIAMELVDGTRLDQWLEHSRPPIDAILAAYRDAGTGLIAAHEVGVVHGDFKPNNVLVSKRGAIKVVDFGLARMDRASRPPPAAGAAAPGLTAAGAGTPGYMAPEQIRGERADEASDQFSFCVALFEALSGRRPFFGANLAEVAERACRGELDETALASIPAHLRPVLRRGLAHAAHERHPSMRAVVDALQPRRRRTSVGGGVGVVVAVIAIGLGIAGWQLRGGDRRDEATATPKSVAPTRDASPAIVAAATPAPPPSPIPSPIPSPTPTPSPKAKSPASRVAPAPAPSIASKAPSSAPVSRSIPDPDSPAMLASVERMNAQKAEESGDGAACLRMLDRALQINPGPEDRMSGLTRARCEMRLGRCAVGTRRYEAVTVAHGGQASWAGPEAARLAENLCPPTDGALDDRLRRLVDQATHANIGGNPSLCGGLLDVALAMRPEVTSRGGDAVKRLAKGFAHLAGCFAQRVRCDQARRAQAAYVQLTTALSADQADQAAADWAVVNCKAPAPADRDELSHSYEYIPP